MLEEQKAFSGRRTTFVQRIWAPVTFCQCRLSVKHQGWAVAHYIFTSSVYECHSQTFVLDGFCHRLDGKQFAVSHGALLQFEKAKHWHQLASLSSWKSLIMSGLWRLVRCLNCIIKEKQYQEGWSVNAETVHLLLLHLYQQWLMFNI